MTTGHRVPPTVQTGSRKWWRLTMARWAVEITQGQPKVRARRGSARKLYERSYWSRVRGRYSMTLDDMNRLRMQEYARWERDQP